jgi:dipeptidyl aminopeptidase/acylaminoacyl peptidase
MRDFGAGPLITVVGLVSVVAQAQDAMAQASAQRPPDASFTLEAVLSAPFPTQLVAAPAGGRVAWIFDSQGSRNVWVAEPGANGSYTSRALTTYTGDDGVEIEDLTWAPDGSALAYTRSGSANPLSLPKGVTPQQLWVVQLSDGATHLIGEGRAPAISPKGDAMAYLAGDRVMLAQVRGGDKPSLLIRDRGRDGSLIWSPDGSRLAFVSQRGDHSLVGVYQEANKSIVWLAPSVDRDLNPVWSPDGRRIAIIRVRSSGPGPFSSVTSGEPWSIWVADAATGEGHAIWTADEGDGSLFHDLEGESGFAWGAGDRIVFPWEKTGWVHLYSVSASGGKAELLTPGDFEVFSASLSPDRREVVYSSNQSDPDHRHIWKVVVAGGSAPIAVTPGQGIEDVPAFTSDGRSIALLHADARTPMRPVLVSAGAGSSMRDVAPQATPASYPSSQLVVPQPVVFKSPDGMPIHGQLFLPPAGRSGVRHPALLFFHGGPYRQMLLGPNPMEAYTHMYGMNQYFASRGYVVLSVNYRGGTGYGLHFRAPPNFGPSGASEDNDIVGARNHLATRPDVDTSRVGVWGGSYGGYMTALALARHSDMFAAGVDYAGVHDWRALIRSFGAAGVSVAPSDAAWKSSPLSSIKEWRSPVLVIQADDDRNVPFGQTVQLVRALREQGVAYDLIVIPDEVHDLLKHSSWLEYFNAQAEYFNRHLGMSPPPTARTAGRTKRIVRPDCGYIISYACMFDRVTDGRTARPGRAAPR